MSVTPCDPGSELRLGGRQKRRAKTFFTIILSTAITAGLYLVRGILSYLLPPTFVYRIRQRAAVWSGRGAVAQPRGVRWRSGEPVLGRRETGYHKNMEIPAQMSNYVLVIFIW